jgi:probable addiction module antidote protein
MATKTIPFDAAEHLRSDRAQLELLADALENGDAGYIANALGVIARARGMSEVARGAGVTREALYKALAKGGDPKLSTTIGVLRTLGFRLVPKRAKVAA